MQDPQTPPVPTPVLPPGFRVMVAPTIAHPADQTLTPTPTASTTPPPVGAPPPALPGLSIHIPGGFTPEQVKRVTSFGGPIIGSMIGGAMGGAEGSPIAGAGLGAMAGDLAAMGVESATGSPPSMPEFQDRLHTAGVEGSAAEFGGQLGGKVIKKLAAPFAGRVTDRGLELVETLGKENVLPGSVVQHPVMDFFENVARYGLTGETRMQAAQKRTQAAIDQYVNEQLGQFGPKAGAPQAMGRSLQEITAKIEADTRQALNDRYGQFWQTVKDRGITTLDTSNLAGRAQALAGEVGEVGQKTGALGQASRAVGALDQAAGEAAPEIPGLDTAKQVLAAMDPTDRRRAVLADAIASVGDIADPAKMTPEQVHRLRSFYSRMTAQTKGKPEYGQFAQLLKSADETLDQLPADLRATYTKLGEDYGEYADTFKKGALQAFLKKNAKATQYLQTLIKPDDVDTVELIKNTLPQEDFQKLQRGFAESLLDNGQGGVVSPKKLASLLGKRTKANPGGYGPEVIEAMFPRGTSNGFYQLQRMLEDTVGRKGAGTGRMWIQIATPSAVAGTVGLITGDWRAGAVTGAGVLLTPGILARILTNPTAKTWLTTGLKAGQYLDEKGMFKASSPTVEALGQASQRAMTNLVAWLTREGVIHPSAPAGSNPTPPVDPRDTTTGRASGPGGRAGGPPPTFAVPGGSPSGAGGTVGKTGLVDYLESLGLVPSGASRNIPPPGTPPPPAPIKK